MLTKLDLLAPPHCHNANKKDICLKSSFVNKYMFQRRKMEYTIPELSFWKYLANPFLFIYLHLDLSFFFFFLQKHEPWFQNRWPNRPKILFAITILINAGQRRSPLRFEPGPKNFSPAHFVLKPQTIKPPRLASLARFHLTLTHSLAVTVFSPLSVSLKLSLINNTSTYIFFVLF